MFTNGCFSGYKSFNANDVYNNDAKVGNYAPCDWFGEFGYTCDGIH